MIPKLIHYSWFSNDEMPLAYKQMVGTWKKVLPDYEIRLWDAEALESANLRLSAKKNENCLLKLKRLLSQSFIFCIITHFFKIIISGDNIVFNSM